jgi:ADP-ribose pyrophosphatase
MTIPVFNIKKIISHVHRSFMQVEQVQGSYESIFGGTKEIDHYVLTKPSAICLTLYDKATDEFVFVKQFRMGAFKHPDETDAWVIEPVAGHIDPKEDPLLAAQREGEEETNMLIKLEDIRYLCKGYTSAGISNEMHHTYFAYVNSSSFDMNRSHGIDDEDIQIIKISREDTMKMIESGEIRTCSAIIGVSLAIAKGLVPAQ